MHLLGSYFLFMVLLVSSVAPNCSFFAILRLQASYCSFLPWLVSSCFFLLLLGSFFLSWFFFTLQWTPNAPPLLSSLFVLLIIVFCTIWFFWPPLTFTLLLFSLLGSSWLFGGLQLLFLCYLTRLASSRLFLLIFYYHVIFFSLNHLS